MRAIRRKEVLRSEGLVRTWRLRDPVSLVFGWVFLMVAAW